MRPTKPSWTLKTGALDTGTKQLRPPFTILRGLGIRNRDVGLGSINLPDRPERCEFPTATGGHEDRWRNLQFGTCSSVSEKADVEEEITRVLIKQGNSRIPTHHFCALQIRGRSIESRARVAFWDSHGFTEMAYCSSCSSQ